MEQFLLFAFIGTFLVTNVTPSKFHKNPSILALSLGLNESEGEARTVCQTEECKKIGKLILESIDKSIDPCDDFYEYACGKWAEHNPIPEGSSSWSLWHMVDATIEQQIENIMNAESKDEDILAVKLAKKWYNTCMDTDAMEKQGLGPLLSTLSRVGGWPMIMDSDEWDEQEYNWQKVDNQYARLIGRNAFHDVRVNEQDSNYTDIDKIIHIDTPHLPPDSYRLWLGSMYNEDEDESDEDPSDEEKQSNERENSPDGSGDDDDDDDDNESSGDDDNDDDNESSGDDTNEQDDDEDFRKKKLINKLRHRKNKKFSHGEKRKNTNHVTNNKRNNNNRVKKQRIKRHLIKTKVDNKLKQHVTHTNKLKARKNRKMKKILNNRGPMFASATTTSSPQITTEETSDESNEDEMIIRQHYANYISKVARAIAKERGIKVSNKYIDKDIEDMIEFQIKLVDVVMDYSDDLEMTLHDFQEWYDEKKPKTANSKINWVYKITELFDEASVAIDGNSNMKIGSPDYFEALMSLLDETSSRTIVNYIHWNFLSRIIKTTTNEMREVYYEWEKIDEEQLRSSICIQEVEMSDILSYEYVRKHFSDDIAKRAMDMIDDIQTEVEYQIKESDWMDDSTKDFILAKLIKMKKFVGYPDWYRNSTIVKRYYHGLIVGKSYYENTLSYSRYTKWRELRILTKDDTSESWSMSPVTLNAFFLPEENSITVTAADFQSPFFAYNRPQTVNFGIIGFVMAHEVNHGFDDTGHLYDKNGNLMKWLTAMAQAYGKRAECFVDQFNNYPIDKDENKKLENYGNQTAGENIADTMGLQAVFRAYQRRERECGKPEASLPGLEKFTNDQLFFLSFANLWCEALDSSVDTMQVAKSDEHSTGRLRVIGSVSNSEDFAKAYNCPIGSAMNPEKKCNIWK